MMQTKPAARRSFEYDRTVRSVLDRIGADRRRRGVVEIDSIIEHVVDYIEKNYAAPISLRDVAKHVGYSPAYLTDAFRRGTGSPITAWIIGRRIRAAQELLRSGNVRVSSACAASGFNDECYFRRQFIRHVGVSPARYRQMGMEAC